MTDTEAGERERKMKASRTEKRWRVRVKNIFDVTFYTDSLADLVTVAFLGRFPEIVISRKPPMTLTEALAALYPHMPLPDLARAARTSVTHVRQIMRQRRNVGINRPARHTHIVSLRKFVHRAYMAAREGGLTPAAKSLALALGSQGITEATLKEASSILGETPPAGRALLEGE